MMLGWGSTEVEVRTKSIHLARRLRSEREAGKESDNQG